MAIYSYIGDVHVFALQRKTIDILKLEEYNQQRQGEVFKLSTMYRRHNDSGYRNIPCYFYR